MATWKVASAVEENPVDYIALDARARRFFAVDTSGSTKGRIIDAEMDFVRETSRDGPSDAGVTWGSRCSAVSRVADLSSTCIGGTLPSTILNPEALEAINAADLWYLVTDGKILSRDVTSLCQRAVDTGILGVPVVFVIVGRKGATPERVDVSVGIAFFANAPNVLVVFKDPHDSDVYLLAGKGCFAAIGDPDLTSWDSVKSIASNGDFTKFCESFNVPTAETRPRPGAANIKLGSGLTIDLELLLKAGFLDDEDLAQLLDESAISQLALMCKTRGWLQSLRSLLSAQKVVVATIKFEDVAGAAAIIDKLAETPGSDVQARESLQNQLRAAHKTNRRRYEHRRSYHEVRTAKAMRRNRLVDHAMQLLAGIEEATYTSDIMSRRSNRARRAAAVAGDELTANQLDLAAPGAFRGPCQICYSDSEILSIALRAADGPANTENFALDFPLAAGQWASNDVVCSQAICFQCALAFHGYSIFREPVAALIPTVEYTGESNKRYIQDQLYMALTGGLRTGASGVSQLFMAIMDRTIREKQWTSAGSGNSETAQKRNVLQWMLGTMLANTACRETFDEKSEWVSYPKALAWAAGDFEQARIDSWAVGYPAAGFSQLVAFGRATGAFGEQVIRELRLTKLMHSVASVYFALLLKNGSNSADQGQSWKQPFLATVYANFHIPLVPVDLRGPQSLIQDVQVFWNGLSAVLAADADFLAAFSDQDKFNAMRRIQLLVFWLVYVQREHSRAKTWFEKIRNTQPLALRVLDTKTDLPAAVVDPILLSIFRADAQSLADHAFRARHTSAYPFATPYGPSTLRCCFPDCDEPFADISQLPPVAEPWPARQIDAIRVARRNHLVKVFGIDERFDLTQTGMPMPTATPEPPASTHMNLHSAVVYAWSHMAKEDRKAATLEPLGVEKLVVAARRRVCEIARGNIFSSSIDDFVRLAVPSFIEAIRKVLKAEGGSLEVWEFEHDLAQRTMEAKTKLEIKLGT